ncbi:hypothetical protein MNBD_PLANCTO02-2900 [hydrothermal vent metagenome]|uniref:EF-hand domain-containing protein n=1 Tax=hydrothermal vent metagenome TaxID=652676 RepID=A0A3B1DXL3_9ZZZZ
MSNRWFTGFTAFSMLLGMTAMLEAGETDVQGKGVFKQLDKNNDGKVTKDELSEKQVKFFNRLIRTGDTNNDGELSQAEFHQAVSHKEQPVKVKGRIGGRGKRDFNPEKIFGRLDKNGDGKLSKDEIPEKMKRRFGALFEKIGKDEISMKEFADGAKRFRGKNGKQGKGKRDKANFPKMLFERFDKNKDGKLTLEELPERMQKHMKKLFEKAGKKEGLTLEEFEKMRASRRAEHSARMFKKFDKNNDGKIQKTELPERIQERFDRMDANNDGVLDKEEIKKMRGRRGRPKGMRNGKKKDSSGRVKRIMEKLDKDGDGKIQRAEAGKRLEKHFDKLDTNGDGQLEPGEIKKRAGRRKD